LGGAYYQLCCLVRHVSLNGSISQTFEDLGCLVVLSALKQLPSFFQFLAGLSASPSLATTFSSHNLSPFLFGLFFSLM
jgi:hypothetical protein